MTASSSSSSSRKKYDVFLSFRGEDTRDKFTSHLHTALKRKKVETYIDNRLERGEEISCGLLKAIEESKISVVIFSENYASSSWCLKELVHILQCKERNGHGVIPVFYHVDPSCVRKQEGSYKRALDKHGKRFKSEEQIWKDALRKAANLSGWTTQKNRPESELVENIVGDVIKKLKNMVPDVDFEQLVGIHQPIQQIESMLHVGSDDVRVVGIWGMGGIGKTTLAKAVFEKLSHQFEGRCFLANVREKWEKCQEECLERFYSELLEEKDAVGLSYDKVRLRRKKVLIVLDDVNDQKQLKRLVGSPNWFGTGSKIIITSRDRQTLGKQVDELYQVEGLNYDDARELFCLNASKRSSPVPHHTELLERVVKYTGGIPLAIEVLASLFGSSSKEKWESLLAKQKVFPDEKIQEVLQLSYDGLDEDQKNIFLDIACFFKGCDRHYVQDILDACGFFADIGIDDLVDKSLITINYKNELCMHDLVQQLGWEIVRLQSPKEPGKRSRLWMPQDIYHVFKYSNASAMIEGIFLDESKIKEVDLSPHVFQATHNLRLLRIFSSRKKCSVNLPKVLQCLPDALKYLCWDAYPSKSLPSDFAPESLVELRMPHSHVERLWDGVKYLPRLKIIDLSYSKNLIEMPDLSQAPNLVKIYFGYCASLFQVASANLEKLEKLVGLDMPCCAKLTVLPSNISSRNLEFLNLRGCGNIKNIPMMEETIASLYLSETGIEELPGSIGSYQNLYRLNLADCKSLKNIHSNIFQLESLSELVLSGCSSLRKISGLLSLPVDSELNETRLIEKLPASMESLEEHGELKCEGYKPLKISVCQLKSLRYLNLSGCSSLEEIPELPRTLQQLDLSETTIEELPSSIELLSDLIWLCLRNCRRLQSLPTSICKLQSLELLWLNGCSKFENFPEILEPMKGLLYLDLSETGIEELPSSIENLVSLKTLSLRFCSNLKFIPISICKLQRLETLDLSSYSQLLEWHYPIVGWLANLKELRLSDSYMSEIPNDLLYGLHSVPRLYQRGKGVDIETAKIEFSSLYCIRISNCKNLRSLPEIPFDVDCLDAHGCTSLETVSSSRTAILQGARHRDQQRSFREDCVLFLNCLKLNQNARNNIIADAQLRILRMASDLQSRRYKRWKLPTSLLLRKIITSVQNERENASICYPGNEITEWYNYQAIGSSININLPSDWLDSKFLGFSLCFVVAFNGHNYSKLELTFECEIHLKTDTNESRKSNYVLLANDWRMVDRNRTTIIDSDHVFLMYEYKSFEACKAVEGTITEVSFHFCPVYKDAYGYTTPVDSSKVTRCGIRLLYWHEAENFVYNPCYWKPKEEDYHPISKEIDKPSGSEIVHEHARDNEKDDRPSKSEILEESTAKEDDVVNNSFRTRGGGNLCDFEAKHNDGESKSSMSCGCLSYLSYIREYVSQWIFRTTISKGVLESSSTSEVAPSLSMGVEEQLHEAMQKIQWENLTFPVLNNQIWHHLQRKMPPMPPNSPKHLAAEHETYQKTTSQNVEDTNGDKLQEEVYQKIQTMKERYLPELRELRHKLAVRLQQLDSVPQSQQQKSEEVLIMRFRKGMLEHSILLLQIPKGSILPQYKEKLPLFDKCMKGLIRVTRQWYTQSRDGASSMHLKITS